MYTEMKMAIDEEKTLSVTKLEELKTNHALTIMQLARGMKRELEELELQLENVIFSAHIYIGIYVYANRPTCFSIS